MQIFAKSIPLWGQGGGEREARRRTGSHHSRLSLLSHCGRTSRPKGWDHLACTDFHLKTTLRRREEEEKSYSLNSACRRLIHLTPDWYRGAPAQRSGTFHVPGRRNRKRGSLGQGCRQPHRLTKQRLWTSPKAPVAEPLPAPDDQAPSL